MKREYDNEIQKEKKTILAGISEENKTSKSIDGKKKIKKGNTERRRKKERK